MGLKVELVGRIMLLLDNKLVIYLAKYTTSHDKNKYIETKYHFIREQVSDGKLEVIHDISELLLVMY